MAENLQLLKRRITLTLGAQLEYSLLARDSRYSPLESAIRKEKK